MTLRPILTMSTLLAGAVSGTAFATQYLTIEQTQRLMFPEATVFKDNDIHLTAEQMAEAQTLAGIAARSVIWHVSAAYKESQLLGYVVVDDVVGKHDLIRYAVGLNPDASVKQIEILTYSESYGYEIKNASWRNQFSGKTVNQGLRIGEGIANISGATLSCTHVTDGVRRIAAIAQLVLKK